jgi:protein-S-isoprenylcysteine O-methyltransferase Ste14
MLLEEANIKSGQWLFRWRSYLPLLLIAVILPEYEDFSYPFGSHSYQIAWEMICLFISLFGLFIRAYTVGYTPKGTSGRNTKNQVADELNTTGLYAITRNPLYLGNFFMMFGVTLLIRDWWVTVIFILAFCLYYERIIIAEESFLRRKFGKTYEDYAAQTPVFIPNFKLWRRPVLDFSLRNVLRREYSGLFGVIAAFTILQYIGDYIVAGRLMIDYIWLSFFTFGLIIYITLRTLKRKTRLLHVEGR